MFFWHPPNPDSSVGLPGGEARFITPENAFPLLQSPMAVSFTPIQPTLSICMVILGLCAGLEVLGSAGWVSGRGGTAGQNHSSTKSITRLDVQAASPTAKMADSTRRQLLPLPKWQTRSPLSFTSCFFLGRAPSRSRQTPPPPRALGGDSFGEGSEEEELLSPPPLYEQ